MCHIASDDLATAAELAAFGAGFTSSVLIARRAFRAKPALQFPSFLRPQLDPLPNHDPPNRPDHDTVAPSSMKPYFKYMTLVGYGAPRLPVAT